MKSILIGISLSAIIFFTFAIYPIVSEFSVGFSTCLAYFVGKEFVEKFVK